MTEIGEHTYKDKITIIYAEDERWFREPMVELLVESGFEVIGALSDGKELLGFTERCPALPDLYLTDLRMPNMNGLDLTREILMKWPDSKVVILTSEIENFYVEEAKKAGAVGFLHKIIDHKNIKRALLEVYRTGGTTIGKINL
ncbi:MAG: response regulator [Chryseobacterium sp.]|uniref:response regulator n=1 Tax=Pedobacter agri TaxID=454586 RepID=UPI00121A48D2|nr:response regulator transcription factor [Pedobacter agri]RZJ92133.1 MAG: response regulator [Chryseobacterium sp.]